MEQMETSGEEGEELAAEGMRVGEFSLRVEKEEASMASSSEMPRASSTLENQDEWWALKSPRTNVSAPAKERRASKSGAYPVGHEDAGGM